MESPATHSESPMELEDVPFPCRGCGEILEEGKAYELGGNRWHIRCFRCSNCDTPLDSDAHLLQLGDGSLICSNCTYSCTACGNKIEDLAFLTGDQAFCASCFRCRNCKRKIENLRYARTSQGIFCMDCHESLMQRRRKKTRSATVSKKSASAGVKLDKSLPSLPPGLEAPNGPVRTDEPAVSGNNVYPGARPDAAPRASLDSQSATDRAAKQLSSSSSSQQPPANQDNILLPSSTYRSNRASMMQPPASEPDAGGEFLIPLAFDPSEEPQPSRTQQPPPPPPPQTRPDDYRDHLVKDIVHDRLEEPPASRTRPLESTSPHIAFQAKGRERPGPDVSRWRPDGRRLSRPSSAKSSRSDLRTNVHDPTHYSAASPGSSKSSAVPNKDQNPFDDAHHVSGATGAASHQRLEPLRFDGAVDDRDDDHDPDASTESSRSISTPSSAAQYPPRGHSLENKLQQKIPRKQLAPAPFSPASSQSDDHRAEQPAGRSTAAPSVSGSNKIAPDSSTRGTTPRATPDVPRPSPGHGRSDSVSTYKSDTLRGSDPTSPSLLRYSGAGDFSLDEDMARILGADESANAPPSESFLRRVSNSVRHGRSISDKGGRLSKELKWSKSSSANGATPGPGPDGGPSAASPEQRDEVAWLREELRKERQRVQDRDRKIADLEAALDASAEVKQANTELHEKRSTMVILDAQKEIALRELTVLTEHLEAEKRGAKGALDVAKLTTTVVREFAESMQKLKESYRPQIEELIQTRNQTAEELANLNRMKDKSFQEFEQLSSKNAQLAELNNQLVHQIQGLYKANSADSTNHSTSGRPTNGLGIYSHSKDKSLSSIDIMKAAGDLSSSVSMSTTNMPDEAESAAIVPGPQVVSIRKGQVRKFNWKKGGQNVAKGVKGLKGAFMSSESRDGLAYNVNNSGSNGNNNNNNQNNVGVVQDGGAQGLPRSQTQDSSRQGFGFFGNQRNKQAASRTAQNDTVAGMVDGGPPGLFGTDLEQRMEVEKSIIPAIVTRCIQEVELRGMDVEGIYRKSGASTQIQAIRDGFEKSHLDYDISDPDLDIHAVTSALKQYFRKLPTPLITFDVYEKIIDTNEIASSPQRIEALQKSLQALPAVHRDVLEFLMFHLKRVVEREKENLMTSQNIAVVFAPTIMRPESLTREMTDVQKKNDVLKFLVENCQEVFMGMED